MSTQHTDKTRVFTFVREFDAPKNLVFNAFSNAGALNEWWGPAESANSVISLDFRPGGIFHFLKWISADTYPTAGFCSKR